MKKQFITLSTITTLLLFLIPILSVKVSAEEMDPVEKEHSVFIDEFDFGRNEKQVQTVEKDGYKITITVEDDEDPYEIKPLYDENWGNGSFNKRVTGTFTNTEGQSFFAKMTATFTGSLNPYIAKITRVSKGDFNATVINPTGEKYYEILKGTATSSEYGASARYREKYNILGVGQHDMTLNLQLNTSGRARIFMRGIW